jgi:hypothetical protein
LDGYLGKTKSILTGEIMSNHKERDPNTTKSGKPNLHSKPLAELQAMANTVRPKNLPNLNKSIQKKVGRGR